MAIIRVHKPFRFSHPNGRETAFVPGEHEVGDDVAAHPYIVAGADGRVETAEQAARHKAAAAEVAAANAKIAEAARKEAEDAVAAAQLRSEAAAVTGAAESAAAAKRAAAVAKDVGAAVQSQAPKK